MPFGRKKDPSEQKPCMVYEFGCLQPSTGDDILLEQIRRRNNLWNKFVEIDHAHQERVRGILALPDDPTPDLVTELEELREQINKIKVQYRGNSRGTKLELAPLQERARELRAQLRDERTKAREARKAMVAVHKDVLDQLESERRVAVKQAMHDSDLWWVNYEEVRDAYENARKRMLSKRSQGQRTELKFHRFDGTGKVSIRYQKGLPVEKVFTETDTRLQIAPVSEDAWLNPVRSIRRKLSRTVVRLRIASDEARRPVWVELPMIMHRPFPLDGDIRNASVVRERVGRNWRYKVVVTVASNALPSRWTKTKKQGAIGIDIGWRMTAEGLRVAYWADDHGKQGQLVLAPEVLHEFNKLPDLRAIRDKHFNEIKTELSVWAFEHEKPEWLTEELKALHAWRSPGRLVTLIMRWRDQRFDGDTEIYENLECWRKRETHLYDWEANLRDQVHRRRREIYRQFAATIAQKYAVVGLEEMNLSQLANKPAPEDGTKKALPADRQRVVAAVSELRLAINNACRREGIEVRGVEPSYTTLECHACGYREKFDSAGHLWRTCPKCKALWDQDHNAARVILARLHSQMEPGVDQDNGLRENMGDV